MPLRVLYQDPALVAVDKPAGFQVHPPEGGKHRVSSQQNCLAILSRQLGRYVYPIHRLDRATSGVLLFALEPGVAGDLGRQFSSREIEKTYFAVARGWVPERGRIDHVLKTERGDQEAVTRFELLARIELPYSSGRHPSSRYSMVRAEPETGRMHQIRRHFTREAHPLIGDTRYGDGRHNRIFRDEVQIPGLLLKAHALAFRHPVTGERIRVVSRWEGRWHRIFELFGICPFP